MRKQKTSNSLYQAPIEEIGCVKMAISERSHNEALFTQPRKKIGMAMTTTDGITSVLYVRKERFVINK